MKKWRATIMADRCKHHLGLFNHLEAAIAARNRAALKYHGDFARIT
jgi:hypothetical protein